MQAVETLVVDKEILLAAVMENMEQTLIIKPTEQSTLVAVVEVSGAVAKQVNLVVQE
jgi:hypothetical protein